MIKLPLQVIGEARPERVFYVVNDADQKYLFEVNNKEVADFIALLANAAIPTLTEHELSMINDNDHEDGWWENDVNNDALQNIFKRVLTARMKQPEEKKLTVHITPKPPVKNSNL